MTKPNLKDYLLLHFIVFIWGFTAILGKLISVPPVELVLHRTFIASLGVAVLCIIQKRNFKVNTMDAGKFLFTGGIIAVHWILFFGAARISNVSVCLVGLATSSLWTSLLEPLFHRRKIYWVEIVLGVVVMLGLLQIFFSGIDYTLGLVLGVASAFCGALFSVINSRFIKRHHHYTITLYEMVGACLSVLFFLPFYATYTSHQLQLVPQGYDWLWISILALVCTVYAYATGVKLMKKFTAFAVNLTINLEPVYGIILAFLIFKEDEKMSSNFYIGAAIILAAIFMYPVLMQFASKGKEAPIPPDEKKDIPTTLETSQF